MAILPEAILLLQGELSKLPGVGPRSAERLALFLVQSELESVRRLAQAMIAAREKVRSCAICGSLTEATPCAICISPTRDSSLVCVVERAVDILSLEKGGNFKGKYHVLGGRLSPLNGVEPDDLRIGELEQRIQPESIRELVLALATDVEGDATSYYLAKRLAPSGVRVTRIAHGLPAGTGLEFADELTLSRALEGRRELQ